MGMGDDGVVQPNIQCCFMGMGDDGVVQPNIYSCFICRGDDGVVQPNIYCCFLSSKLLLGKVVARGGEEKSCPINRVAHYLIRHQRLGDRQRYIDKGE